MCKYRELGHIFGTLNPCFHQWQTLKLGDVNVFRRCALVRDTKTFYLQVPALEVRLRKVVAVVVSEDAVEAVNCHLLHRFNTTHAWLDERVKGWIAGWLVGRTRQIKIEGLLLVAQPTHNPTALLTCLPVIAT